MIAPKRPVESRGPLQAAIAGAPLVVLALAIVCNALLYWDFRNFRPAPEIIFGTIILWPVEIACGVTYAMSKKGSLLVRVFVVLVGLGAPFIAANLGDVISTLDSWKAELQRDVTAYREEGHFAFLQKYMSKPRAVIDVQVPFVVVEGGYSLALYDVPISWENRTEVQTLAQALLAGKRVTATFPPDFLARYHFRERNPLTAAYARGPSRDYGDAPAIIAIDSMIVNEEIKRRGR